MLEYLSFGLLALILGIKHSYDADHLIAVSNILRKAGSIKSAVKISSFWALGHMMTAAIITIVLFYFRESLLRAFLGKFEIIVAIMLILLGILSLKDSIFLHSHLHRHGKIIHSHHHLHSKNLESHAHRHIFGIGILHGLASNDELLILFTASLGITTIEGILFGVGIFSFGVIVGMVLFSCLFSYSILKIKSEGLYRFLIFGTGSISIFYGMNMIISIGAT